MVRVVDPVKVDEAAGRGDIFMSCLFVLTEAVALLYYLNVCSFVTV